ncbi:COP9 signalosome complex subunit 1 [Thraustotheca clavata]|uniref:COP9 signalosome complex subunit 1 n=1 Tax=Thraustotheca clavata TaxID=74557 RepID=A0A1W0A2R9_9STRA|nr:COP9 signalosome complex subunit 1 [Thraustotheca clavata]
MDTMTHGIAPLPSAHFQQQIRLYFEAAHVSNDEWATILLVDVATAEQFRLQILNDNDGASPTNRPLYIGMCPHAYYKLLAESIHTWQVTRVNPLVALPPPIAGVEELRTSVDRILNLSSSTLFPLDSNAKLDQFIIAIGGARGIMTLLGIRTTIGSQILCPPTQSECLAAFNLKHGGASVNTKLTIGARQWTKHAQRSLDKWWGINKGSEAQKNLQAELKVREIMDTAVWINTHGLPNGPVVFEIRQQDGYGARWGCTRGEINFRGFRMGLETFDLEAVASKYSGVNRTRHLQFIVEYGKQCSLEPENKRAECLQYAKDALRMLLTDNMKATPPVNVQLYRELTTKYADLLPLDFQIDNSFIDTATRANVARHERLEQELNSYKSSLIKESIRIGHNDLGDFFYRVGDLSAALRCFVQARDYCMTDKHIIEMCFNVIRASVHLKNFGNVTNYLVKLEQSPVEGDNIFNSKVAATFGLVHLANKKYYNAALKFVECHIDIGSTYDEVIHAEDIALFGGLCALASFERNELKDKVTNNPSFKAFLELVPRVREMINDFYTSQYASCLNILNEVKEEWLLDMNLSAHVEELAKEIRHRAIVQYFFPYLSVDMKVMAEAFNTSVPELEEELRDLILRSKIQARIDSHNMILFAHQPDQRTKAYKHALSVGQQYTADTRAILFRMNLVKNNVIVEIVQRDLAAHSSAVRLVLTKFAERILALETQCEKQFRLLPQMIDDKIQGITDTMQVCIEETKGLIPDYSDRFEVIHKQIQAVSDTSSELHQGASEKIAQVAEEGAVIKDLVTNLHDTQRRATIAIQDAIQGAVENLQIARGEDKVEVMENIAVVQKTFAAQVDDIYKKVDEVLTKPASVVVVQAAPVHPTPVVQQPHTPADIQRPTTSPSKPVEPVVIAFDTAATVPPPKTPMVEPEVVEIVDVVEKKVTAPVLIQPSSKIPVGVHSKRRDNQNKAPAAQTTMSSFQLPSEMKQKIEHNITATLEPPSKPPVLIQPKAMSPLLPPPKALSPPELSESTLDLRLQLQTCQSNIEMLRGLVEATRSQLKMYQESNDAASERERQLLRAKIKKVNTEFHEVLPLLKPMLHDSELLSTPDLMLDNVPSLRIALLELSRNLNVVRQTRKHMSIEMRRSLEKIIDVINEAYQTAASDPIEDPNILIRHVERVARVLAFGIQSTICILSSSDMVSMKEIKSSIEQFSGALTERLQVDDGSQMVWQHISSLSTELHQAKFELREAIQNISQRLEESKAMTTSVFGEKLRSVHSRQDINDRGKAIATIEHELNALRGQMDERDELLQKLVVDMENKASKRQLLNYLSPENDMGKARNGPKLRSPINNLRKNPPLSSLYIENSKAKLNAKGQSTS